MSNLHISSLVTLHPRHPHYLYLYDNQEVLSNIPSIQYERCSNPTRASSGPSPRCRPTCITPWNSAKGCLRRLMSSYSRLSRSPLGNWANSGRVVEGNEQHGAGPFRGLGCCRPPVLAGRIAGTRFGTEEANMLDHFLHMRLHHGLSAVMQRTLRWIFRAAYGRGQIGLVLGLKMVEMWYKP